MIEWHEWQCVSVTVFFFVSTKLQLNFNQSFLPKTSVVLPTKTKNLSWTRSNRFVSFFLFAIFSLRTGNVAFKSHFGSHLVMHGKSILIQMPISLTVAMTAHAIRFPLPSAAKEIMINFEAYSISLVPGTFQIINHCAIVCGTLPHGSACVDAETTAGTGHSECWWSVSSP